MLRSLRHATVTAAACIASGAAAYACREMPDLVLWSVGILTIIFGTLCALGETFE